MKNRGIQITIALICMVLGMMLAVQFKSIETINSAGVGKLRAEELQFALNAEKEKLKNALSALAEMEKKLEEYHDAASKNDRIAAIMQEDLERAKMLAGLTTVQGEGIIVKLDDSKLRNNQEEVNENYFIIHDSDILLVINELRASDAEAISLNDERVIATSQIRCAGPVLSINDTTTSAPFNIKAIGDAAKLESGLRMRGGVVDALQQWGIEVTISREARLVIPKYNGVITHKYAYPVKEEVVSQ